MNTDPTMTLIGILAVWRITHLLSAEDGPWRLLDHLRRLAGDGTWGRLLDCFYCLSLWVAAAMTPWLATRWSDRLLLWPALSGGAILLERITREKTPPAAWHFEEGDGS